MNCLECTLCKFALNLASNDLVAGFFIKLSFVYKYAGFFV